MRKLWLLWIIVLSLTIADVWADAAKSRVLFILDGSGSMWGQVDGQPKINIGSPGSPVVTTRYCGIAIGAWDMGR